MFAAMFVVGFAFSLSSAAFAQEAMKKEAKKENKQALKSVACGPTCGFMVRSHDEAELVAIVMDHAKEYHDIDMTEKEIKGMMKTEEGMKTEEQKKPKKKK
ncbi:MAG: DUF1059 domain-containing protein [Ignavibacteria bacterium]|nr:DUF1059 domain-containing protein [Ignavibacteria bacterium]